MAVFRYSILRLALIAVVFGIAYGLGAGLLTAGLLSIIVSWTISYLFLKPQADESTQWFVQRREAQRRGDVPRFSAQVSADEAAEDAIVDAGTPADEDPAPQQPREPGVLERHPDSEKHTDR